MKKITLFIIILISSIFNFSCKGFLAPLTTASSLAATYFIDATGGNDANDGLTEQTAWQTLSKVNSYKFAPGENVLFKRGERWGGTLKIPSSGTIDMQIVFGAYGNGPLPIIDATALTAGWTAMGNNLYSLPWVIPDNLLIYLKPSVLVYGGEPMPPVYTLTFEDLIVAPAPNNILKQSPWQTMIVTSADINANTVSGLSIYDAWDTTQPVIALLGTIDPSGASPTDVTPKLSSLTEPGHWYWHDNTLYLYSDIPPGDMPDDMKVEVVSQLYAIDSKQKDYITIQDLAVRGGNSAGVILQFTDHAIVQNLLVYDTGMLNWGAGITVWGANDNTISDNEVRSTLKTGILCTAWNGPLTTGNNISDNYIHHTGGPGVRLDSANVYDNIIEHNTIGYTNQLNFDSGGIKLQGSGTGNVIRFNKIFNGGSSKMMSAGIMADGNPSATQFYYNLIYGNTNGGIALTGSGHDIYNNTLYHNDESLWNAGEIFFFPLWTGPGVSNCTVKNNIMVASDGKPLFHVNNWYGFDSTQGHDIDYNAYIGNTAYPFIWGDQVISDFDTWQTQSGQDAHSLETPIIGLNNPPIDFELSNNSAAIDAGIDVGLSNDFAGKPVPQNNSVDIGALEYPISGNIALSSVTYLVAENGMSAVISVTRNAGSEGAVSIDYTTSDGTALAGSDYTAASGTLFWDDGDTLDKSFTVTILGDALVEGDETVNIVLANSMGGAFLGAPNTAVLTITDVSTPSPGGGGGGGGGRGIFGDIIQSRVIGYHLDGYTESGIQIYMPVTKGFKALKGAQEYVRSFAPDLARNVREFFDYLEQKADADKEGFLYQTGTHIFPILGKIVKEGLELIGEEKYISDAYSETTISIEEFKKLAGKGFAIAPKVVKDFQNQEVIFTDMVY